MKYQKTKFKDLKIYKGVKFNDSRGYFREVFKDNFLKKKLSFNFKNTFLTSIGSNSFRFLFKGLKIFLIIRMSFS